MQNRVNVLARGHRTRGRRHVAAHNFHANTFKHEIDGVAMVPATFPENISSGERNRLERAKFLLKELVLRARPKALERYAAALPWSRAVLGPLQGRPRREAQAIAPLRSRGPSKSWRSRGKHGKRSAERR